MDRRSLAHWRALSPGRGGSDLGKVDMKGTEGSVSRRKVFKRAAGLAAVGAAGGSVLAEAFAPPALAADKSAVRAGQLATTVEQGAVAPAVVNLTDTATIAVDASLGNDYRVTIAANRTLGNPSNATDGQKMVLQVTQGSGGNFTLSYASSYEFSTGLPQPTLSTTAGDTDLLAFIYNAAKGKWLLAAYVIGFSSTAAPPPPPGTFRLFPSTNGPASPVSYTGPFLSGVVFEVTTGGCWLEGFWWWVCSTGQSTSPQTFALWQPYSLNNGKLIAGSTVTSGALTAGQWNFVQLATPVPLAIGVTYIAATGFSNGFPDTNNQFGAGDPFSAGITQGPLFAYSDQSGSAPVPNPLSLPQSVFSTAGSDPTVNMPNGGSNSANFWMDLQVTTTPPAGTSYRLWPNYPLIPGGLSNDTGQQTMGTEFLLSKSCTLNNIWFYSPPGVSALPSRCAIWDVSTQTVVAGTDNTSPAWSGAAGSGWVACSYSGITLPAGNYKTSVFYGGGSKFYTERNSYFSGGGPASSAGIVAGPLTAPNVANATSPGQTTYQNGAFSYPNTYDSPDNGEIRWVDVEVTPT
jgi:hypothetical protein